MSNEINIRNKRASFDYEFLEEYTAGIVLTGTEIKSIRAGKASLVDSYCYFHRGELWIKGMNISEYKLGTYYNHEEKRERKLLLTHKELVKLERKVKESGLIDYRLQSISERKRIRQNAHRLGQRKKRIRQTGIPQTERCQKRHGPGYETVNILSSLLLLLCCYRKSRHGKVEKV